MINNIVESNKCEYSPLLKVGAVEFMSVIGFYCFRYVIVAIFVCCIAFIANYSLYA